MNLFDDFERTDSSWSTPGEDIFAFINRVDQPVWQQVREELERWFAEYPAEHAADLRSRFRNRAADQHYAAWWELYLHRLFRCLGFSVDVHPELQQISARPYFRMTRGSDGFLLEATTTFSGIVEEGRHPERESWITGAINRVSDPNFFVALEFERVALNGHGTARSWRRLKPGSMSLTRTRSGQWQ